MNPSPDPWKDSTALARAILHDRAQRRKWLGRMMLAPLALVVIGLWGVQDWIWANPWRAIAWWGTCAATTLIVVLFALYDALAAIREERANRQKR